MTNSNNKGEMALHEPAPPTPTPVTPTVFFVYSVPLPQKEGTSTVESWIPCCIKFLSL